MMARLVLALNLFIAALTVWPGFALAEPALCGGKPTAVQITEAVDGNTLKLADGRVVRLANVIVPLGIDGDSQLIAQTKQMLREIANGKEAMLFLTSQTKDRYGRISAQAVVIGGNVWLEAEMLSLGIARFFPAANEKCAAALLHHEAKAREKKLGLWGNAKFAIFDAAAVEALLAAEGRFVVAEGTIQRVGEARGRLYLDFGRRFTEDFTIVVPDSVRKSLIAQGSDPKGWRGRRIRVRGILFSWGGPAIELQLAQAIELLDRDIPKSE